MSIDDAQRQSFDQLYREHFGFVWRCLRRFGVSASASEDAAQDTFVVLHRRLSDLRPEASPKGFLFAIALRVARDYRRSSKTTLLLEPEQHESPAPDAFERTSEIEAARALDGFLDGLDEDKRAVFVLVDLEGLSVPEVSDAVDANLNTVYSRLRAARSRFETFLREQGSQHG